MSQRVIARFHVDQAAEMSEQGRKDIADWLRKQADTVEEEGHNFSSHFVARYIINTKEPANAE